MPALLRIHVYPLYSGIIVLLSCFLLMHPKECRAVQPDKFKVGVILPLTGPLAEYGKAAQNGIELARTAHPDLFQKIEFVFDDSQYDSKVSLSAYQRMKTGVRPSMLYVWGDGPNDAVAPVAEADKFPLAAMSAQPSVSLQRKYVVRFAYYDELASLVLLQYLRSKNFKRFAFVKAEVAFLNAVIDGMRKNLKDGEVVEVVDNFQPSDLDFKASITKLRQKNFDALGVFLVSGQVSQFYRQSKQLGLKATTFGTDFFNSLTEVRDAGGAMTGAVFVTPYVSEDFARRYLDKYGNDNQLAWAGNSFEFAMLVARLFGQGSTQISPDEVMRAIREHPTSPAGAASYEFHNTAMAGPGFDFKLVMRRVEAARIVDLK